MAKIKGLKNFKCKKCNITKNVEDFYIRNEKPHLIRNTCIMCMTNNSLNWKEENREQHNKNWMKYYYRNLSKVSKRHKKTNRSLVSRYNTGKKSAEKRNIDFKITKEQYETIVEDNCHYCGYELPEAGSGLDRKNSSIGYILGNIVPCCDVCNLTKNMCWSYSEFLEIAKVIKSLRLTRDLNNTKQFSRNNKKISCQ